MLHAEVSRRRLIDGSKLLGNALIEMYSKWGALERARQVLDEHPAWDVASWTRITAGYAQHGSGDEALKCLSGMQGQGLYPNVFTYVCILKACGNIRALQKGEEIFRENRQQRLVDNNLVLGNALVEMYDNCGMLAKAAVLLDELPQQDVVRRVENNTFQLTVKA
ncbi:hypothetical protein L7F22_063210 [Adiantum nelumboides]|nr:hypothetical protein [Adiantum nelumboides]